MGGRIQLIDLPGAVAAIGVAVAGFLVVITVSVVVLRILTYVISSADPKHDDRASESEPDSPASD